MLGKPCTLTWWGRRLHRFTFHPGLYSLRAVSRHPSRRWTDPRGSHRPQADCDVPDSVAATLAFATFLHALSALLRWTSRSFGVGRCAMFGRTRILPPGLAFTLRDSLDGRDIAVRLSWDSSAEHPAFDGLGPRLALPKKRVSRSDSILDGMADFRLAPCRVWLCPSSASTRRSLRRSGSGPLSRPGFHP